MGHQVITTRPWSSFIDMIRTKGFPGGSDSKELICNVGNLGSIPGLGRSTGGGHGNPLQYSCLEIAWTEEPDELQFVGSQIVGHD